MPYTARKAESGDGFEVVNEETGDVKSTHATQEEADRQVALLEGIEHKMKEEPE
jgi:hypothetical protein